MWQKYVRSFVLIDDIFSENIYGWLNLQNPRVYYFSSFLIEGNYMKDMLLTYTFLVSRDG